MKIKDKIIFFIIIILIILFLIHILFYNNYEIFTNSISSYRRSDELNFYNLNDIYDLQILITDLTTNINDLYINRTTDPNYIELNSYILEIQSATDNLKKYCDNFGDCNFLPRSNIIHIQNLIWSDSSSNQDCFSALINKLYNDNIISQESYNNISNILNKISDSLNKLLIDNNYLIPTPTPTSIPTTIPTNTPSRTPRVKYINYLIIDPKQFIK